MCSYLCSWCNVYYVHLLHPPCLLSAFVTSFSVYFDASASKYSAPYSRSEADGGSGILEFPLRMTVLGSLFVIRKAKVKPAVTKDWISGFTEMAHRILFGCFFLYLVFVSMPKSIHTDIMILKGCLCLSPLGIHNCSREVVSASCMLNVQRLLLADGAVFCELLLSEELKFKLLERKLEKLLGCIKPNFMSSSYCCLMSKITLTPLSNWHNGLFYAQPEYEPVLWLQKRWKLSPLSLTALEGSECDTWLSSRQKYAIRHWPGERTSPRNLHSQRHAWESLCFMLVLWLTCVISQVMTSAFLSSLIHDSCSVLLAVVWHQGIVHLFFREFIALSTRAWVAHMGVWRRTTYSLAPISS